MNAKHLTSLIVLFFCFLLGVNGQDQIRIMDADGESIGRFKTQLYLLEKGELIRVRGNSPSIETSGDQVELVLRLKDLRWFDDDFDAVTIKRSEIVPNEANALHVSSSSSSYTLDDKKNQEADIKFRVLKDGKYSLKIPFKAASVSGQYVQMFEVEGLSGNAKSTSPIGTIADLKKEWRDVDKKSLQEVDNFLNKYKENEVAIEERLIAIAERTKLRIEKGQIENAEDAEEAWLAIGDSDDEEAIKSFLDNYPNSKYAEAARAKLGLEANVLITSENESRNLNSTLLKVEDNIYKLDLSHLGKVDIKLSHPDDLELFENGGNLYSLEVKGSEKYKITAVELSTNEKFVFDLDNTFTAELESSSPDVKFIITGGVSPYTVEFYKDGEEASKLEARFEGKKVDDFGQISVMALELKSSGMEGRYRKVTVRDFTTQAVSTFPIDIQVTPQRFSSTLIIGVLGGLLVLGAGFMFFYNKRQKETRKAYQEKAKAFQQTQKMQQITAAAQESTIPVAPAQGSVETNTDKAKTAPRKITITKQAKKTFPANGGSNFVSSGKMKITKLDAKGGRLTGDEFRSVLSNGKYAFLDLTELWPDSAIKELYISNECVLALGNFLREENLDKVIAEMEGAIPEVGGFLMGYHQLNEDGFIRVTMDEFVPFVPEYHDVFKIEIGTATLVQELGDAQDKHPDKDVIGWFHTHPGHGLFLSNSDLSVQRHFPQRYQIAMEIDSLTDRLDTAFFTRKFDGSINNVEHRKKGANWFSWKKIENI